MRGRNLLFCSAVAVMFGALFTVGATTALAAVPTMMSVQGKLTDPGGNPVAPGAKGFVFRIFDASSGGTQIWPSVGSESQSISTDGAGLWTARVGAVNALTEDVFDGNERWLQIEVNGEVLATRMRLITSPYAQRVATVDGATGGAISSSLQVNSGIRWGGQTAPYTRSDMDASGVFIEHAGSNSANDGIRIQTSQNGAFVSYGQLIIDPSTGFAFTTLGAANGNVGIGTTSPIAKLEVRGDIRLGSSGQYRAAGGEENLRIIRGIVNTAGGLVAGEGFTPSRLSPGNYVINFTTAFSGTPSVTATVHLGPQFAYTSTVNSASAEIRVLDLSGVNVDGNIHFIAIGRR